jgi:hypothetical protein
VYVHGLKPFLGALALQVATLDGTTLVHHVNGVFKHGAPQAAFAQGHANADPGLVV